MRETPTECPSVITNEMRALLGVEGDPVTFEVTTTGIRMFARAVGYEDPVFYDRQEAQRRGYRDLPSPPGYLGTAVFDPKTADQTEGVPEGFYRRAATPYTLLLNGGTEVEYTGEPICAGDILTARTKLDSLSERHSASLGGPMLIQVNATTFRNESGAAVAVLRGTEISYGPLRE